MKVLTVYTASYDYLRESGNVSKIEMEDKHRNLMMFETRKLATIATREKAKKDTRYFTWTSSGINIQSRQAVQLANGRRFLLSEDHGKAIPKLPKPKSPLPKSTRQWVDGRNNQYFLYTLTVDREKITIWDGKGKPPGDYLTELAIEDAENYYLLDSSALIRLRAHYEISQMYKDRESSGS